MTPATLYLSFAGLLNRMLPTVLPLAARLVFAGVLLRYFLASVATKIGPGPFGFLHPTDGAFAQIYPRLSEAVGYDPSRLGLLPHAVVLAGTLAEAVLPVLIVVGLATRLAALGMIGFVIVQSLTDIFGHGLQAADIGAWFDAASDGLIADQRAMWMFLLISLALTGAGPLALDRMAEHWRAKAAQP